MIQVLDLNRVDVVVTARFNGLYQLRELGIDSISILSPSLDRILLYHYLHKNHKDLVPKVDRVIKTMKERGEVESLREKIISELLE